MLVNVLVYNIWCLLCTWLQKQGNYHKLCKKWWEEALSLFLNEPYVEIRPFEQKEPICLLSLKDQETKVCAKVSQGGLSFEKDDPVFDDSKSQYD